MSRWCIVYCICVLTYIFAIGLWSCPATTGTRPTPCNSFSFTDIDDYRGVLFAGYLLGGVSSNDTYLMDLQLMV